MVSDLRSDSTQTYLGDSQVGRNVLKGNLMDPIGLFRQILISLRCILKLQTLYSFQGSNVSFNKNFIEYSFNIVMTIEKFKQRCSRYSNKFAVSHSLDSFGCSLARKQTFSPDDDVSRKCKILCDIIRVVIIKNTGDALSDKV